MGNSSELNKTTISVVLAIWGEGYSQFLPQWFQAVENLDRKYEELVVVSDNKNINAVLNSIQDFSNVKIQVENSEPEYSNYWNKVVELASSKWIAFCSADDSFLPEALNQVDQADSEDSNLICDNLIHKDSSMTQSAYWEPEQLNSNFRLMGANPMTKKLFQSVGGFPYGFQFPDWGLALRMKKSQLVKPFYASTNRIIYDVGYNRLTMSGASLPQNDRSRGQDQIAQLVKDLELD